MTRFSSAALDLSRIDRSSIFPTLSFEADYAARMVDLQARMLAAGIDYDVGNLETDPGAILQQSSGYRELLVRAGIQDAQASVLLAFARGLFLDRLGDAVRCTRLPAVEEPRPFAEAPQDWESDDRYRARIQLAPEAFSTAGTRGGYLYHAVSTSVHVRDVGISVLRRGAPDVAIEVTVLSSQGDGAPSAALLDTVRKRLASDSVALMTDVVSVRAARIVPFSYAAKLRLRPGPDSALIVTTAETAVRAAAETYKRVGGDLPSGALDAAAYVAGVEEVTRLAPATDFRALRFQAAHLTDVALTTEFIRD